MNLFELFVKIGAKDEASGAISKISHSLGNGLKTAAKVGLSAVGTAMAGITALTTAAVKNYAEYEQLVGGVETLFEDLSVDVEENASKAFKTAGLSANEYMETAMSFAASLNQSLVKTEGNIARSAEITDRTIIDMADNANKMGTDIEMIQNAYQGFAKQNYTMLDNLKLGYGGTKTEMERLIKDANRVKKANGQMADLSIDSFADITEAIHIMQEEMGISGTTSEEASSTISGSISSMKSAWSNLVTGIADENADFEVLVDNFVETLVGDRQGNGGVINNIIPRVEIAMQGAGKMIEELMPIIIDTVPQIVTEWLPKILESGISIVSSIYDGIKENHGAIIDGAMETVWTLIDTITDPETLADVLETGVKIIGEIARGFADHIPDLIEKVPDLIEAIANKIPELAEDLWDIGKDIVSGIWEGMIKGWNKVVEKWPSLVDSLANAGNYMATGNVEYLVNGSHAGGLRSVPFDGYIAELHQGERVLTREEANDYNRGEKPQINIYQTIQSKPMTAADLMMQARYQAEQAVFLSV